MSTDTRKMMVYLPEEQSRRVHELAARLDRPRSWIIRKAIDLSFNRLRHLRAHVPEKEKRNFWNAMSGFDRQMIKTSAGEIEQFAVDVVKDYRKKIRGRS